MHCDMLKIQDGGAIVEKLNLAYNIVSWNYLMEQCYKIWITFLAPKIDINQSVHSTFKHVTIADSN